MRVHLLEPELDRPGVSKCGKPDMTLTAQLGEVTCKSCLPRSDIDKTSEAMRKAQREARGLYTYADNTFKGRGHLRCYHCQKPLRDHHIGQCVILDGRGL